MASLADDVYAETLALGGSARILNSDEVDRIRTDISRRYGNGRGLPIANGWDRLVGGRSKHDPEAWRSISKLIGPDDVTILIEDFHGFTGVWLSSGLLVSPVLANTVGFVFYVIGLHSDYLLCFNDHDVLIGLGNATAWFE